ncbi:hypothetical protein ILUMI_22484 [Ignelater luminosus]|uniref:Craniofacial development protein 2 n=1 Tax=Ignelater luminosus TaxID=2038154 RepID=A0A8K0CAK4_IGNLU|nr:hypothetical protein ILUMI_22484 [Ignelater luminosus]
MAKKRKHSVNDKTTHRYGVGIIISKKWKDAVLSFVQFSERIILIQTKDNYNIINIIVQLYAPTADKDEEELEQFYSDLKEVMSATKKQHINIVMEDLNAKVEQGKFGEHVGNHGLGSRNERGDRLVQFCQNQDLIIASTFYKLPPR